MPKKILYFIQSIEIEIDDAESAKLGNLWSDNDLEKLLYKQYPFYQLPNGILSDSPVLAKFGEAVICKSIDDYKDKATKDNV